MKKNLSPARLEQLMLERGFKTPEKPRIVERSRTPFPESMREFVKRREEERIKAANAGPLPHVDPQNVCPHCSGAGCANETVRHGDDYCVRGTVYDRPSVYRLKQLHGLVSEELFSGTMIPAINSIRRFLNADLSEADVRKH